MTYGDHTDNAPQGQCTCNKAWYSIMPPPPCPVHNYPHHSHHRCYCKHCCPHCHQHQCCTGCLVNHNPWPTITGTDTYTTTNNYYWTGEDYETSSGTVTMSVETILKDSGAEDEPEEE